MEPMTICLWALFALVLLASYRWAAAADRCHALREQVSRADGRIADLLDELRRRQADIERLEDQVSAMSQELREATIGDASMVQLRHALMLLHAASPVSCTVSLSCDTVCPDRIYGVWRGRRPNRREWVVRERLSSETMGVNPPRHDPMWDDLAVRERVLAVIRDEIRHAVEGATP